MGESDDVRKREKMEVFVDKKGNLKSYEEMREMKKMKKKKKRLVTVGKNEKARTHLMTKLCVV